MKLILTELGLRGFYFLMLCASLYLLLYLTLGYQLEYFSGVFSTHYQSGDFCFESFDWQWFVDRPSQMSKGVEKNLCTVLHPSKSWSFLSLGLMGYFNSLDFPHAGGVYPWVVLNPLMVHVVGFLVIQSHAFVLPGWLYQSRQVLGLWMALVGLSYAWVPDFAFYWWAILEELTIEPLDSELGMGK
jgi:hypothetical protein